MLKKSRIIKRLNATEEVAIKYASKWADIKNKQEDFIKYLEKKIKDSEAFDEFYNGMRFRSVQGRIYEKILKEYKEIMGGKYDNR